MSDRKYFLLVDEPEPKPGDCYPGDAPEPVEQTLEEILVSLEKTRDFVGSFVRDVPEFCVSSFYIEPSRSWRDKLEDPSTCSVVVGWRWFTDGPSSTNLAGKDDVIRVFDVASVRGHKSDCSDLLDDARWAWVHKYSLPVTEENVLAYARFLYELLPFDAGTVRLVPATEPMADWERDLLEQQEVAQKTDN
jgi:hypothetical protein